MFTMDCATCFKASEAFSPSKTNPSKALRSPRPIPVDSRSTSRPVNTMLSRIRASSPSTAFTTLPVPASVASSAAI